MLKFLELALLQGDKRYITITKKPPAKDETDVISALPSLSSNAQVAFSSYIAKHPGNVV